MALRERGDDPVAGEPKTYTQEELDAMVAEATDGLKKSQRELLAEKKKVQERLTAFDGIDPDKYKKLEALELDIEQKRAKAEGDFTTLQKQMQERTDKVVGERDAKIAKLTKALDRRLVQAELRKAIGDKRGMQDSMDLLVEHGARFVKVRETETDFEPYVADEHGNALIADAKGTPMDIPTFVEQTLMVRFPRFFEGSGGSGSGATKPNGGAGGGGSPRVIAAGDNKAFIDNLAEIAGGKVDVR